MWSVAVLPGGQVATGGYDGAVRLLDRHNGDLATELYQHSADTKSWLHTTSLAVSPDGKEYIAAGSRDALVSVWANSNTNAGSGGDGDDGVIAASSGSSQPTGGGGSNERAATPPYTIAATPVIATLQGHTDVVWAVAWAPDGLQLASASDDGTSSPITKKNAIPPDFWFAREHPDVWRHVPSCNSERSVAIQCRHLERR